MDCLFILVFINSVVFCRSIYLKNVLNTKNVVQINYSELCLGFGNIAFIVLEKCISTMGKKIKTNRFLQIISRIYCRLDYYCRFASSSSVWEEFFIMYNLMLAIILIPCTCLYHFSCGYCNFLQGFGKQLILSYFILGIVFSTIMSIVFDKRHLNNYHRLRSFAGSAFVKQLDEKRHNASGLVSVLDFIIFYILLLAPVLINIFCIILITK